MKLFQLLMVSGLAIAGSAGCGGVATEGRVAEGPHDEPIAASVPRAQVRVAFDLDRRVGCDEAFDLAVYAHRGVERIAWEPPTATSPCAGRVATVTFVPTFLPQVELVELMRGHARSLEVKP